jgi:hypothetical protein
MLENDLCRTSGTWNSSVTQCSMTSDAQPRLLMLCIPRPAPRMWFILVLFLVPMPWIVLGLAASVECLLHPLHHELDELWVLQDLLTQTYAAIVLVSSIWLTYKNSRPSSKRHYLSVLCSATLTAGFALAMCRVSVDNIWYSNWGCNGAWQSVTLFGTTFDNRVDFARHPDELPAMNLIVPGM